MTPAIASSIPLVCRSKPPGTTLGARITKLTALTTELPGAGHYQQVARACSVLNFAALIASDAAIPGLAANLSWRQWDLFASAGPLDTGTAVMGLMPLVNLARLAIRAGDGDEGYDVLQRLYRAAQRRESTTIYGHLVNLAPWTRTTAAHRKLCQELWGTILVDGARALARSGHWTQAAKIMASHRGIGNRLLDGRQISIMALTEQGLHQEAIAMIDASRTEELWEQAVAAILRISCMHSDHQLILRDDLDQAVRQALTLTLLPDPMTAASRIRIGLATLDLAAAHPAGLAARLQAAVISTAACDAYAARDVLTHRHARAHLSQQQEHELTTVVTTAGLGARHLPPAHMDSLTAAVRTAEQQLQALLAAPLQERSA
jgi:hypothetical protein